MLDWTESGEGLYSCHSLCFPPELIAPVWKQTLADQFVELSKSLKHRASTHTTFFKRDQQPVNQSPEKDSNWLYRCVILSTPTHTELKLESIRIADGIVHIPALVLPRCFLTLPPDNLLLSSLFAVLLGLSRRVTSLSQSACIMSWWNREDQRVSLEPVL